MHRFSFYHFCVKSIRFQFLLSTILILFSVSTYAQSDNFPIGTRAASMGNAYVAESDIWSSHHNQAGLGFYPHFSVGFHNENKFLVQEYSLHAIGLTVPVNAGTFGISYSYFGYSAYNESKLGLGFGKQFGNRFAAGVQLNYHNNYLLGEYGNRNAVSVEGGIQYKPTDNIILGAHLTNPTHSTISNNEIDTIPSYLNIGMTYRGLERILFTLQVNKEIEHELRFLGGLEYEMFENLYLRAGFMTNPMQNTFGLGYKLGKLSADIAFTHHQILGFTPHFSFQAIIR